jgi:dolichol kinase
VSSETHSVVTESAAPATEGADFQALVGRTAGLQPWRRFFHAATGVMLALGPDTLGLAPLQTVAILTGLLVVLLLGDIARLSAPRLNALFFRAFPSFASPREASRIASSTWYVVGALLAWAFFDPLVAISSILVLALADSAASFFGRVVRSPRVGSGSVFGSFVFFAVATAILIPVAGWLIAPLVAAGVMVVEATPWRLDDNLTVPLSTALLLTLLT